MEIRFEAGLKRPRDATESAKLVSEAAVAVRCHVCILPTWIQYMNDKDETQFNTFLDYLYVSMVMYGNQQYRLALSHTFQVVDNETPIIFNR